MLSILSIWYVPSTIAFLFSFANKSIVVVSIDNPKAFAIPVASAIPKFWSFDSELKNASKSALLSAKQCSIINPVIPRFLAWRMTP